MESAYVDVNGSGASKSRFPRCFVSGGSRYRGNDARSCFTSTYESMNEQILVSIPERHVFRTSTGYTVSSTLCLDIQDGSKITRRRDRWACVTRHSSPEFETDPSDEYRSLGLRANIARIPGRRAESLPRLISYPALHNSVLKSMCTASTLLEAILHETTLFPHSSRSSSNDKPHLAT